MMKDAYAVLKQKEADLARVRHEAESLRIVASLLVDDPEADRSDQRHVDSAENSADKKDDLHPNLDATGPDGLFSSAVISGSKFWNVLKRAT
jgi:hypothetical protein